MRIFVTYQRIVITSYGILYEIFAIYFFSFSFSGMLFIYSFSIKHFKKINTKIWYKS